MAELPMEYLTRYRWTREGAAGSVDIDGHDALPVGGPHDRGRFSPEHLLVSAAEICLANYVVLMAERAKLEINSYDSEALGQLEFEKGAGYRFSTIAIRPRLSVPAGSSALARRVVDKAHRACLIARSLTCPVRIEPQIDEA